MSKRMDKDLFSMLCCPYCKGSLRGEKEKLICISCKKEFKVKQNIPILIEE